MEYFGYNEKPLEDEEWLEVKIYNKLDFRLEQKCLHHHMFD
jgi:hypothetical protein